MTDMLDEGRDEAWPDEAPDGPGETGQAAALVFEYRLDAPPAKVWRALSIPALREHWLPGSGAGRTLSEQAPRRLELALPGAAPPGLESTVRFTLRPEADGGTRLTIVHVLAPPCRRAAANDGGFVMRA